MRTRNPNLRFIASKNISVTLLDLLGTLCLEFATSLGSSSSLKLESVSQIYVIIGSMITLIVKAECVLAVLKTFPLFIISYAVRATPQRTVLLSRISDISGNNVSVLPDEYLYHILIYGNNVYNSVSNGLIIDETITYVRNSGRFTKLEAFG